MQGVAAALRTQNGQKLALWLQLTGGNGQSALAQLGPHLIGIDLDSLLRNQFNDPVFGTVISSMVTASVSIASQDFESGKCIEIKFSNNFILLKVLAFYFLRIPQCKECVRSICRLLFIQRLQ